MIYFLEEPDFRGALNLKLRRRQNLLKKRNLIIHCAAMLDGFKVLIIGGGLGGLALAQGLRKQGFAYEIFERDETADSRTQGWALSLHWYHSLSV